MDCRLGAGPGGVMNILSPMLKEMLATEEKKVRDLYKRRVKGADVQINATISHAHHVVWGGVKERARQERDTALAELRELRKIYRRLDVWMS
jgi:hypothetical protein